VERAAFNVAETVQQTVTCTNVYTKGTTCTGQIRTDTSLLGQDRSEYSKADTVTCSVGGYRLSVGGYYLPLPNIEPITRGTYLQSFVSGNEPGWGDSMLLGQDLWKQLKRVSVPTFSGDKKMYQNWKAAFTACNAPTTPEYKLLALVPALRAGRLLS